MPIKLPRIRASALDGLLNWKAEDATVDRAKDFGPFSVGIVAWAIQCGISIPCIERYLKKQSATDLQYELDVLVDSHSLDPGYPILFFAVERNSPELVKLLCKFGAKPDRRAPMSDIPVLAYAVISFEHEMLDTTFTVIALLAAGTDPYDLPVEMWKDYVKSPTRLENIAVKTSKKSFAWCTLEIQDALCRTLNLMQRYSLWKTEKFPRLAHRKKQFADLKNTQALFEIPYYIVGQHPAIKDVLRCINAHLLVDSSQPLVLLFAGASGHGKTELAERMGKLLSLEYHKVNCADKKHETDMFGPQAPYYDYQRGSPLNNHLATMAGQSSVVFLDEFEKTTEEVWQSLLLLFQSGDYRDRRDSKSLDCSKTIWILATNSGEEILGKFWVDHLRDATDEQRNDAPFNELQLKLKAFLATVIGKPLSGRMTRIIPFFSFNKDEQAVVAYKFLRDLRMNVRKPICLEAGQVLRHLHLNLVDDGKISSGIASVFYQPGLGARSMKAGVECLVTHRLCEDFLEEPDLVADEMNEGPLFKYDVRVSTTVSGLDEVVVKEAGVTKLLSQNINERDGGA